MRRFVHLRIMKKTLSRILLAIYLCASCSGLLPIVQDLVAHIFWHQAHLKHVHHGGHGDAHVAIEMAQLLDHGSQDQTMAAGFDAGKVSLSVHLCQAVILELWQPDIWPSANFPTFHFWMPQGVVNAVFLPPRSV